MTPNVFLDNSHCAEDFFTHSLAYLLNLFPSLGDALAKRIAVTAGKRPSYFGDFAVCEFIAHESLGGHRTSRPDLKLVCSRRTIYFENKLDSPLSFRQLQRHSKLIARRSQDRLIFVSNISHKRRNLRDIPCYLHPRGRDHFLWTDLMPVLETHHRKGSLAARILDNFREALKFHGMLGRTIAGAKGSLYTIGSEANHLALSQLSDIIRDVGFKVVRKLARESTLRVYPRRHGEYPLLNPQFHATATWLDDTLDIECVVFAVLSRKHGPRIKSLLAQFSSHRDCSFVPDGFEHPNGYTYYGHFVLPVEFSGNRERCKIEFSQLHRPLARIYDSLNMGEK